METTSSIKKESLVRDIPYSKNIDVSSNELFLRSTINRNTEKLLANDIYLHDLIEAFRENGDYTVLPWKERSVYSYGDVVIYTEYDKDKSRILNLYMLQCVVDRNSREPKKTIVDGYVADFSETGWKNLNPFLALYHSDDPSFNLSNFLGISLSNRFELSHELDLEYHKFGNLSAHAISSVVLKKDVSNISDERDCGYWAYDIQKISTNSYDGTMKKWGMGVVEYDLEFRLLGSQTITKIEENGEIASHDYLAANSFMPMSSDFNDNYFLNRAAYGIFSKNGDSKVIDVDGIYQTNLLSTVNVYHGKMVFPIPFIDLNYMVFASSITNGSDIVSPNVLTFADKTKNSIEFLYAIPNYNALPMREIAMRTNRFQCQIVGRWR